jgi:hypothetical protein
MHPLALLPTESAYGAVDRLVHSPIVEVPHPARVKLMAYATQRDGTLNLHQPKLFFARLFTQGKFVLDIQAPPSPAELLALGLQFKDVFDDDKCAFSLHDLKNWGASWNDVIALKPTLDDLLAVNVSQKRSERVNPVIIRELYGEEGIRTLYMKPYAFGRGMYLEQYVTVLTPNDLDALGIDLKSLKVTEMAELGKKKAAHVMLRLAGPEEWTRVGLNVSHLKAAGLGRTLPDVAKTLGWDVKRTMEVFNK